MSHREPHTAATPLRGRQQLAQAGEASAGGLFAARGGLTGHRYDAIAVIILRSEVVTIFIFYYTYSTQFRLGDDKFSTPTSKIREQII